MIKTFVKTALLVSVLLFGATADAGVIYSNGAPDLASAFFSDIAHPQQIAGDFSLSPGASEITDIHWWGAYGSVTGIGVSTDPDDFTIRLFDNVAGAMIPGTIPFYDLNVGTVQRNATGDSLFGFPLYSYWLDVSPIALAPDTTYWLSILNNTPNDTFDWAWATSSTGGTSAFRIQEGTAWGPQVFELAFFLTDDAQAIPEPSTLVLLGTGLLGVIGIARRRKS